MPYFLIYNTEDGGWIRRFLSKAELLDELDGKVPGERAASEYDFVPSGAVLGALEGWPDEPKLRALLVKGEIVVPRATEVAVVHEID